MFSLQIKEREAVQRRGADKERGKLATECCVEVAPMLHVFVFFLGFYC